VYLREDNLSSHRSVRSILSYTTLSLPLPAITDKTVGNVAQCVQTGGGSSAHKEALYSGQLLQCCHSYGNIRNFENWVTPKLTDNFISVPLSTVIFPIRVA